MAENVAENDITGINAKNKNDDTRTSGTDEQQPVDVNGINDLQENDVSGINTNTNSNSTVDVQGINSSGKQGESVRNKKKTDNKIATKGASSISNASKTYSYHKRKPKPTGKHHHPVPPPDPPINDADVVPPANVTTSKKPEFVTQEFGLLKRKKRCKLSCPMCKHPSYSQAEANHHYRTITHPSNAVSVTNFLITRVRLGITFTAIPRRNHSPVGTVVATSLLRVI